MQYTVTDGSTDRPTEFLLNTAHIAKQHAKMDHFNFSQEHFATVPQQQTLSSMPDLCQFQPGSQVCHQ